MRQPYANFGLMVQTQMKRNSNKIGISIGNSMIFIDIWHKYHEWYFKIVIRNFVKFEAILKYHKWYLCQISRSNHAIIYLYYYPQKDCNFHM